MNFQRTTFLFGIFLFLNFLVTESWAQFAPGVAGGIIRRNQKYNEEHKEEQIQEAEQNIQLAKEAYAKGDLEGTKKYLDESEKKGRVTADFYLLLGNYYFDKGQYPYAKRYWEKGVAKKACTECDQKLKEHAGVLVEK